MRTYVIDKSRVSYAPAFDLLYIGYGDNGLDVCDTIEDVGSHITVMTNNGEFSGAEIYDFKETYGEAPVRITVPASTPFILEIPVF